VGKRTPLYLQHLDAGAKIVEFAGWDMPINYGSQIEEHNQVRSAAGVFDVSHMTIVDVSGTGSREYLRRLLANDVAKLQELGHALYSAMLNPRGGVIDDLIVYQMSFGYRMVLNCATREKDLDWMNSKAHGFEVAITEQPDLAILAVHGPTSIETASSLLNQAKRETVLGLQNFRGAELGDWFIARTGYTGERGVEFIVPTEDAAGLWRQLLAAGVKPIGLGARDTLRLEAGMNLYGQDMDESTSPIISNMTQTIAFEPADRDFIGRAAVTAHMAEQKQANLPELVGLSLAGRGVLRAGQKVNTDKGEGQITSGSFSPTLKHSIALARIPSGSTTCQVDIRGNAVDVRIVQPNFVRFGKKVFE